MLADAHVTDTPHHMRSRRALVGGGLLATLGTISFRLGAAAQATPHAARASGMLLVQSFAYGSIFPTQGDVGAVPYTAILWDAAERGFFLHDAANGTVGIVATDAVLSALAAADEPPPAALLTLPAGGSGDAAPIWAIRLVSGEPGSDPGAGTYQGEPLPAEAASAWLETTPPDLPTGPQKLGAGYLDIGGLPGAAAGSGQIRLRQAPS